MNVLIRFEDTYGCKTLFEDLHPGNCIGEDNITSLGSFGGDGVFKV